MHSRVELAGKRLDDIMKDRKTHENLKEKAFEEFKQELAEKAEPQMSWLVIHTVLNMRNKIDNYYG